ncbi:hypothetical protein OCH239_09135 [Roseivivax halodurans JCM 10272]|uniref:DUF5615 domain-containing protein n=1 Tax=Roseivivax halodurans JCM 10272 TaxID=1449350 RepID=X7EET6_9RHOB|nr:DUF5615 family PIN-like protein [Roseivivax halodurans]ETX13643.1 hypothetical protein OCH239_09135 [Roseivivax halodurans JCM 10272]
MLSGTTISFLTDQNVPESVPKLLIGHGHDLVRVRDIMSADAKDPVVAAAAMAAGRTLITWDRDFNHQRFLKPRFAALSRIGFSCPEPDGAARLKEVLDLIEFTFARADGAPVKILVGKDKIQIRC